MPSDDADAGFFRNLSGLATDWVRSKRKTLQTDPETNVDSMGGGHRYSFGGQDLTFEDLRDIKDIRDSGGQVAQLMEYKTLLNFGEGAEIHVEDDEDTEQVIDGDPMTLSDWLEAEFPTLDLLVLDLGADALWYPYAVGEIQETVTDDFKEVLPAEPWTLLPKCDAQGEIQAWQQRTKAPSGGYQEQTISPDDLWHIAINKASARDQTGISEVLRNRDEIQAFKENEQAINKAIELHGFPQRHVTVGREEGAPVSDDDLRRVRTIFDPRTTESNTAYFTGQDVNVETLEAHNFDYSAIHEMDMRNLTTALGLPLEAGNVGSDGLGSGKPAELRFALLKLAIKANQRSFSTQFVEKVMRPVIRDYSPFDHTADLSLSINDPLEDIGDMADVISQIGDYMTNEQVADRLDIAGPEDDEVAESYRSPADIEAAEEGDGGTGPFGGDGGGFFSDGRTLAEVPDNAVSISDRSEAPDGAQVITGPGGGLYYIPSGGADGDGAGGDYDGDTSALPEPEGDVPDSVDLSNATGVIDLSDSDVEGGRHADDMKIAETEDGDHIFLTEGMDSESVDRALSGSEAMRQAGANVPEHHYYDDTGELAVEGIEGETVAEVDDVDTDSLRDNVATAVALGNIDMNPGNVVIDNNGEAHIIDTEDTAPLFSAEQNAQQAIEFALPTVEQHGIEPDEFIESVHDAAQEIQYSDGYYEGPEGSSAVVDYFAEVPPDAIREEMGV